MPYKDKVKAKEYRKVNAHKYADKRKEYMDAYNWKYCYKGTDAEYNHYIRTTKCECCGCEFDKINKKCQDHDHDTGKLRGVICHKCNTVEGLSKNETRSYDVACYAASHKSIFQLIAEL